MIPRFKTLEALKPETLGAHLRCGSGAVVIEDFLWDVLAKIDRKDLLFGDAELRAFTLATRTMNSELLFRRIAEAHDAECPNAFGYEPEVRVSVPGGEREDGVYQLRAETVICLLFLDARDRWTAAPIINGTTIDVPRGSVIVVRGDLPIGFTENVDPESRLTLVFGFDFT